MEKKKPNPPNLHHYIPAFYTKRWARSDDLICQFSRPYREVKPLRRHPNATGFRPSLYKIFSAPMEHAQRFETDFFQKIDTSADNALKIIEKFPESGALGTEVRTPWTRFLISLLLRQPEQIDLLRQYWIDHMYNTNDEQEAQYQAERRADDPKTYKDFVRTKAAQFVEESAFSALSRLIDTKDLGRKIAKMVWGVIDTTASRHELLTSDRPIIRTTSLADPRGHMIVPIGPRKLFVATQTEQVAHTILTLDPTKLVSEVNRQIVGNARRLVFGSDDRQLRFVSKHMSKWQTDDVLKDISASISK